MKRLLSLCLIALVALALSGCGSHIATFDDLNLSSAPAPYQFKVEGAGPQAKELTEALLAAEPLPGSRYQMVRDAQGTVGKVFVMSHYYGVDAARGTKGVDANGVLTAATVATYTTELATSAVPFVSAGLTLARWSVNGVRALSGHMANNPVHYWRFDVLVRNQKGDYLAYRLTLAEPANGRDAETLKADMARNAADIVQARLHEDGGGTVAPGQAHFGSGPNNG